MLSSHEDRSMLVDDEIEVGEEASLVNHTQDDTVIDLTTSLKENTETEEAPIQKQGWGWSAWNHIKKAGKTIGIGIVSIAAALPTALNAAGGDDFTPGEAKTKWPLLSKVAKALAITRGVSSLSINTILNFIYLPIATNQLINGFKNIKSQPLRLTLALLAGIATALASYALGMAAFQSLGGNVIATLFAGLNTGISFAQNFAGTYSIIAYFINKLDITSKIQLKGINKLRSINKLPKRQQIDLLASLQAELDSIWNEKTYTQANEHEKRILLSNALFALNKHLLEKEKTFFLGDYENYVTKNAGLIFDIIFTVAVSIPTLLTFTQTGYDAFRTLESLTTDAHKIENLTPALKILTGLPTGLASVAFTALQAFLLRSTAVEIVHKMAREPKQIPLELLKILPLGVLNYFASSSMANVGRQIAENNILHIPGPNTPLGKTFIYTNQIAGATTNVNATIGQAILGNQASPSKLDNKKPRVEDILVALQDTFANQITAEDAQKLQHLWDSNNTDNIENDAPPASVGQAGLFAASKPTAVRVENGYKDQTSKSLPIFVLGSR